MEDNDEVIEGFICPICMTDLKSPVQLTKHFEEVHNDDPEILKSLKDLFGKAKKKITNLKNDEINDSSSDQNNLSISNRNQYPEINWGPQEIGATNSHTNYFREIRNTRLERYSTETNKLLIRLDKLLNNLPSDPIDRKLHEQKIVPWIDEKDVKLCPSCAKSFHVARRKHHCRLCGAIMCNDCTMFLSITDSRKMTNPTSEDDTSLLTTTRDSKLTASGEQHFRLCIHCKDLLDARERLKLRQFTKPIVGKFYETMRTYMEEATRFLTMYMKMWQSLSEGETTYDLRDAQILRIKIAKIGENIDNISKRILAIGTSDIDNPPQGQVLRLHQMIRRSAEIFCKDNISTTPSLPSENEYILLQKNREKKIEQRIAYERQLEIEEAIKERKRDQKIDNNKNINAAGQSSKNNEPAVEKNEGWGPSNAAVIVSTTSMDPIIEQMNNLRSYIKQARSEFKYDEVATLENNLRELQSAYFLMKQNDE
ncbi:rabenosyn-5 isoform X2 [Aphidius gifuensis]|uniref:rabenosyn-5 isoform X2 n=1 Tax=Aphidius gifuensis TaxID=684658 RepID=UPI001CDBBB81|nr:rabenosyn-5 isoform X2 [Aphidius gifuensis]